MKEYTAKEIKELTANKYTLKVTRTQLSHTIKFKEEFWTMYKAGLAPRKILSELGYRPEMFGQKRIDSLVQGIKKQAISPDGFTEGYSRQRRISLKSELTNLDTPESVSKLHHEVQYLRQEVDFIKKILKTDSKG